LLDRTEKLEQNDELDNFCRPRFVTMKQKFLEVQKSKFITTESQQQISNSTNRYTWERNIDDVIKEQSQAQSKAKSDEYQHN
jgi:hypothetical protein